MKWIVRHPFLVAFLILALACYALGPRPVGNFIGNNSRALVSGVVNFGAGFVSGVAP